MTVLPSGLTDGEDDGQGVVLLVLMAPSIISSRPAETASSAPERAPGDRVGCSSRQPVAAVQA